MRKYIFNAIWLMTEKFTSVIGVLVINIYAAKYLGPEQMGLINYAMAISALIVPIAQLGSQNLIFDKTAKNKRTGLRLLISSINIRKYCFFCLFFLCSIFLYQTQSESQFIICLLIMISSYFKVMDVYKPFYDARLKSKINSITTQLGLISALVFRFLLVICSANVIYFAIPYISQTAIPYFIKKKLFNNREKEISLNVRSKEKYKSYSIKNGVPLMIAAFSIVVYIKVAQIILANLTDLNNVGLYNAASTLAQGWSFLPIVIMTVILTKVLSDKKEKKLGFSFIVFVFIVISLPVLFIFYFFDDSIVRLTYGAEYSQASSILFLFSVSTFFSVLGTLSYRVILHYSGYLFLMKKMLIMAILNIILSYFFILNFGLYGAALSVLITEIISSTVANYFFIKCNLFKIHLNSIFAIKYVKNFL